METPVICPCDGFLHPGPGPQSTHVHVDFMDRAAQINTLAALTIMPLASCFLRRGGMGDVSQDPRVINFVDQGHIVKSQDEI